MSETWMVAHDFSPCSDAALAEAARLVAPLKGTLRIVHVHAPVNPPPQEQWGEETYALEEQLRADLRSLAVKARTANPGVSIEVVVSSAGEPARAILDEADRSGADHIVVGTHGKTGLTHLLLGSVAEQVVRHAKVPVLVVREASVA